MRFGRSEKLVVVGAVVGAVVGVVDVVVVVVAGTDTAERRILH